MADPAPCTSITTNGRAADEAANIDRVRGYVNGQFEDLATPRADSIALHQLNRSGFHAGCQRSHTGFREDGVRPFQLEAALEWSFVRSRKR